jgi:hypothetical protein
MKAIKQPWIYSYFIDSVFILLPPFFSLLLIYLFPLYFNEEKETHLFEWIFLILFIDVAHVYSTLYRTYFDKETFENKKALLINTPLFSFITGVIIYEIDSMMFWRLLAYLAVFHFIRQQYGFMRIYSRKESLPGYISYFDSFAIYCATLYPVLFWHLKGPRNFHWFVQGDFYYFGSEALIHIMTMLYLSTIILYLLKEGYIIVKYRSLNLPRNLIIAGTFLSWYFGIVYYNGDLIFTLINVVSHGIPYMALIWIYGRKKYAAATRKDLVRMLFKEYAIMLFLGLLFTFAYLEEGFWDALVWNDHREFFSFFYFLPKITDHHMLALLIPLLSLPQITHYVLDGFIWKLSKDNDWKKVTLENKAA